jgi:hypothetical protein
MFRKIDYIFFGIVPYMLERIAIWNGLRFPPKSFVYCIPGGEKKYFFLWKNERLCGFECNSWVVSNIPRYVYKSFRAIQFGWFLNTENVFHFECRKQVFYLSFSHIFLSELMLNRTPALLDYGSNLSLPFGYGWSGILWYERPHLNS